MTNDAKAARPRQTKAPAAGWTPDYAALLDGTQHAFGRWVQGMFTLSQEITRFTQTRLQEDMAAWWTLAACRSPEEASACQQRIAAKATEQYAEEITKLSQLMMSVAREGALALQQRPGAGS